MTHLSTNQLRGASPNTTKNYFIYIFQKHCVVYWTYLYVVVFALFTVETLRQLIFRDLEEDCWSHESDDTPTNETTNERSPFTERPRPESLETVLSFSTNEWEAEAEPEEASPTDAEQPSVQVVRKGNGSLRRHWFFNDQSHLLIRV